MEPSATPVIQPTTSACWIRTRTGRQVNPLRLRVDDIRIEDIAHALACVNRFAGHAREPLNVAQHSVYVCRLCAPEHRLQGLLHDAAEAYLGDVTKWLKATPEFAGYREAEHRAQTLIYANFGCAIHQAADVRRADDLMVRYEGEYCWGTGWTDNPRYAPLSVDERAVVGYWEPWDWRRSRYEFLDTFRTLAPNVPMFYPALSDMWSNW